ncbi:MAG: hypothetical protein PVJ92_01700 [Candidatus Dependentiae bacterium]|jgi:hypothetical protein
MFSQAVSFLFVYTFQLLFVAILYASRAQLKITDGFKLNLIKLAVAMSLLAVVVQAYIVFLA